MERNAKCTLPFMSLLNRQNHGTSQLDTLPVLEYGGIRFSSWTGQKLSGRCHYNTKLFEHRLGVCAYVKVVARSERRLEGLVGQDRMGGIHTSI